jgi:dihydrofolate reductase
LKVILYSTITTNGLIAKEDGSEDFLSDENWKIFVNLFKNGACLVWGRSTYESVLKWDKKYLNVLKKVKKIIISKNTHYYEFTVNSPKEAIKYAMNNKFKTLIIGGGSKTYSAFIKENLIDEMILNIEPVILGKGIKLFAEDNFEKRLKLLKVKKLTKSLLQVHYKVQK